MGRMRAFTVAGTLLVALSGCADEGTGDLLNSNDSGTDGGGQDQPVDDTSAEAGTNPPGEQGGDMDAGGETGGPADAAAPVVPTDAGDGGPAMVDAAGDDDGGPRGDSAVPAEGGQSLPDSGDDAAAVTSCNLDEACCPDDTCDGDLSCLGETCSCIVALHGDHALRTDGTVYYYGAGGGVVEQGETGTTLTGILDIYQGTASACGLRNDNTVWCWATTGTGNNRGELGRGTVGGATVPLQANPVLLDPGGGPEQIMDDATAITSGSSRCYLATTMCAVRTGGSVWCWGSPDSGGGGGWLLQGASGNQPYPVQITVDGTNPLLGVDQVSLGSRHACVLASGQVRCWGANVGGPLGQGNQTNSTFPVNVSLPGTATKVGAGSDVTCAQVADELYCWGANNSGQVGIGVPADNTDGCINFCKLTPTAVVGTDSQPLDGILDFNVAYLGACALRDSGELLCWGQGINNVADTIDVALQTVDNVALQSSCSSASLPTALRWLTRDNDLRRNNGSVTQVCPGPPG